MHAQALTKLAEAAPLFAALGDGHRLHIVGRLCTNGPQSITSLTDGTEISRQAITKHLLALQGAGLVRSKREGRERIWELQPKKIFEAQRQLERISREWDAAIERLRSYVEDD